MFQSHAIKVILGFCAMIVLGLVSLVIIDSMKPKDEQATASGSVTTVSDTSASSQAKQVQKTSTVQKKTHTTR